MQDSKAIRSLSLIQKHFNTISIWQSEKLKEIKHKQNVSNSKNLKRHLPECFRLHSTANHFAVCYQGQCVKLLFMFSLMDRVVGNKKAQKTNSKYLTDFMTNLLVIREFAFIKLNVVE